MNRLLISVFITGFLVLLLVFMFPGTDHLKKEDVHVTEFSLAMFKPVQTPVVEKEEVRVIKKIPVPEVTHLTQEVVSKVPEVIEVMETDIVSFQETSSIEKTEVSHNSVMEDKYGLVDTEEMILSYRALILERIGRKKIYPSAARKRTQEGEVKIQIKIGRNGGLILSGIVKSSGYKLLDQASLRAVKNASPFPSPQEEEIEFSFIMDYQIE